MRKGMKLAELKDRVTNHGGIFECARRSGSASTPERKVVHFEHVFEPPVGSAEIPDVGKLRDFYETFGSLTLYHDSVSGDAAFHIARPEAWDDLMECFRDWVEDVLDDDPDWLPYWVKDCLAIGEIPQSGNYLLVPLGGNKAGHVFEFEHDGYEFIELAPDIEAFVLRVLEPDSDMLTDMASHMSFIEGDPMVQWWISTMRDNRGRFVKSNS